MRTVRAGGGSPKEMSNAIPPAPVEGFRATTGSCAGASSDTYTREGVLQISLYKILFHFKALWWESILPVAPPTCNAYPIAILLHDLCTIYAPPADPPSVCHTPYTIGDGNIV